MNFFDRIKLFDRLKQRNQKKAVPQHEEDGGTKEKEQPAGFREERTASQERKAAPLKGDAYRVLLRPLVSEKAVSREQHGVYTFVVHMNANKQMVKDAVTHVYGIKPKSVRLITTEGKVKRLGRHSGRRSDSKKAIVTLPKGKTMNVHEGV